MRTPLRITWPNFAKRLSKAALPDVDLVVAIARGGLIPGAVLASKLEKPLLTVWLRMYEDGLAPVKKFSAPRLVAPFGASVAGKRILLVDDLARSGATLSRARQLLPETKITTFVVVGKADVSLFPQHACVIFPWSNMQHL